jgi:hypothetical protein
MKKHYLVNSRRTCELMKLQVEQAFSEGKYIRFQWETGEPIKQEQLALFHIWLRKWVGHNFHKTDDEVSKHEIEKFKQEVKEQYYQETGAYWMVETVPDKLSANGQRVRMTSAASWSNGEAFKIMEWMQMKAAERGLILESTGEHQKLKEQQTET